MANSRNKPADDAGHEKKRNENRDERDAQRNDREPDLLRAFERGFQRRIARFDETHDVFDHHDRVVDHESGRDGQRHQRKIIETESGEIHDAERADERQRQRDAGDDSRPKFSEKEKHHHHHERDGEEQCELHIVNGSADRFGAVGQDIDMHRRRHRAGQTRKQLSSRDRPFE